ncbi:TPA: hypothetical protein ACHVA2_001994, partial [Streptococcus suis]
FLKVICGYAILLIVKTEKTFSQKMYIILGKTGFSKERDNQKNFLVKISPKCTLFKAEPEFLDTFIFS